MPGSSGWVYDNTGTGEQHSSTAPASKQQQQNSKAALTHRYSLLPPLSLTGLGPRAILTRSSEVPPSSSRASRTVPPPPSRSLSRGTRQSLLERSATVTHLPDILVVSRASSSRPAWGAGGGGGEGGSSRGSTSRGGSASGGGGGGTPTRGTHTRQVVPEVYVSTSQRSSMMSRGASGSSNSRRKNRNDCHGGGGGGFQSRGNRRHERRHERRRHRARRLRVVRRAQADHRSLVPHGRQHHRQDGHARRHLVRGRWPRRRRNSRSGRRGGYVRRPLCRRSSASARM